MSEKTVEQIVSEMFTKIEQIGISPCICGLVIGSGWKYCPWCQQKNTSFQNESYVIEHDLTPEMNFQNTCSPKAHAEAALWQASRWDQIRSRFCPHCSKPYEQFLLVPEKDPTVLN